MNKNVTALILIVISIAIYLTFTQGKIDELNAIRAVNTEYQVAIDNSEKLVRVRDQVLEAYNKISNEDKERLNKLVPNNVDNVRLIIDVKDDIAARHGLFLKNIKTSSPSVQAATGNGVGEQASKYGSVTLSFTVTTTYEKFVDFLRDIEASLRIMDVSKLTIAQNTQGTYDFSVELKTYWLRQ